MKHNLNDLVISVDSPIELLLNTMSKKAPSGGTIGIAFVVDSEEKVLGVVSDSDLRKWLLLHDNLPQEISLIVKRDFLFIELNQIPDRTKIIDLLKEKLKVFANSHVPIRYVPVLEDGKLVSIVDLRIMDLDVIEDLNRYIIVGLGYVGLTFLAFLASKGKSVIGVENNPSKYDSLIKGQNYVHEDNLDEYLEFGLNKNRIRFETEIGKISNIADVKFSNYYLICVPTPVSSNGVADDIFINNVVEEIARYLKKGDVVFLRSTVPVGTTARVAKNLSTLTGLIAGIDFTCCFVPERTIEGKALQELQTLPQIVGGFTSNCSRIGATFFEELGVSAITVSSTESAEIIKISSNAFRDYIFAFSNTLALMAEPWNVDIKEIVESANFGYPRNQIPKPSPGVGGPCLSKDPYLVQNQSGEVFLNIFESRKINELMPIMLANRVLKQIPSNTFPARILLIGMAFKGIPETNDIRNSPSFDIEKCLLEAGHEVMCWDAVINSRNFQSLDDDFDVFIIANNHPSNVGFMTKNLVNSKRMPIVVDPWNLVNLNVLLNLSLPNGFYYMDLSQVRKFPN